ncbi:unnamed protein product [Rhizoctonia solani]|uniref:Uncharacterized protein n=1 Tax=Rhizoctonia solani TaxID=456999 RepID=A0A8H3B5K7_9AGAM|nr:unnamed protein product [Rhizoctonia solani]CAE6454103.1 unnamed protein product [Rhizoctonia solani]
MSNLAAASVQSATYATERTKQETNELGSSANTTAAENHDDFQSKVDAAANQARVKKEEAVAEGKADVEQAKATTASYIDQARDLVGAALGKAQNYVSAGQERLGATTTHSTAHVRSTGSEGPHQGGFTEVLTGAAVTALQTTKGVLATAQAQLAATGQSAHTTKPHPEAPRPTSPSYTDAAKQHAEKAKEAVQPHLDASKHSVPDSTGPSAPSISSTAATVGSNTSTEATSASRQITSPSTITYPQEPKTEAHHVTTEGGAAPPEKVDDKAVNKLADELTSTKVTDTTFATSTH